MFAVEKILTFSTVNAPVMKNNATLKRISDLLHISISTVSRALKDHPDISAATKKKVLELAKIIEYEPNANAINLRTSNSRTFGVIIPEISNFFYHSFIAAIEEESRKKGYSLIILQSGEDPSIENDNLRICRQNRVAGVFVSITSQTSDLHSFDKMSELHIPLVFFDKVPSENSYNKVCLADSSAGKIAAETLIARKRKNILAIFGNIQLSITSRRLEAFNNTFSNNKAKTQLIIEHAHSAEQAREKVQYHFSSTNKPDAIFCMSDEILTGVMKAVQELHLDIPSDLSIIAISNGFIPTLYHPAITYVETSGYKLGKLAYSRMLTCLGGNAAKEELQLESTLVKGGSI